MNGIEAGMLPGSRVSICIPTLRRLNYLREAVASALAQTYPAIEVVIGDEGVEPAIGAWAGALAARDPRVRYQRHMTPRGLAGNWNALAALARGDYLVIIGDDDRLLPEFVSRLMAARQEALRREVGEIDVIFANHYLMDSGGERLREASVEQTRRYGRDRIHPGEVAPPAVWVWRSAVPLCAALLRAEPVRRLRFDETLNAPELELLARWTCEPTRFVFVPDYLAEYRVHGAQETAVGLRLDRLVPCLERIEVAAEIESEKRRCLHAFLPGAVNAALAAGDRGSARRLLASTYYPVCAALDAKGWVRRAVQQSGAYLGFPGPTIFRRRAGWRCEPP